MLEFGIEDLLRLTLSGESETVEYKESFNDDAIEAIGAFSNANGGRLLIGVKDSGDICGVHIGKKSIEDIANRIQESCDPRIQPSIISVNHDNKHVVIISVSATRVPLSVRGRYFKRAGKSNQRMSHEEIMQRMISSAGQSWDAIVEPLATLDEMDDTLIRQFISTTRELGRRPIPEQSNAIDVLRKFELIIDEKPTRAAILLFGKNPGKFYPGAFLKIGRFRSPTLIVDDREAHGSLIEQLNIADAWFRERLQTNFVISAQLERDVQWEYPLVAIREALCNNLCHKDYTSNTHSQIRLYDDKLEFWNIGGLPPSLTPALLYKEHDSIPRNRKIAEAFYNMGLIERWGTGTTRITEQLQSANLPLPEFISEHGRFKLIFYKHMFDEANLIKQGLSERQIQAVIYAKEHGSISNTEYQSIAKISKATATRELTLLKEKNVFVIEGVTGRGTVYKLKGS